MLCPPRRTFLPLQLTCPFQPLVSQRPCTVGVPHLYRCPLILRPFYLLSVDEDSLKYFIDSLFPSRLQKTGSDLNL